MANCPPLVKSDIEKRLQTDFDNWFAKLQELSAEKLNRRDWIDRWTDGYTPSDALMAGEWDERP